MRGRPVVLLVVVLLSTVAGEAGDFGLGDDNENPGKQSYRAKH